MSAGNLELVEILTFWAVTLPAVIAVIVFDERRLRGAELARAWPPVSRDAAIFAMWQLGVHPICLLVHFARTRHLRGAAIGLAWTLAVFALGYGAALAVEVSLGG